MRRDAQGFHEGGLLSVMVVVLVVMLGAVIFKAGWVVLAPLTVGELIACWVYYTSMGEQLRAQRDDPSATDDL